MVAGGVGKDTLALLLSRQLVDCVEAAAELEAARLLLVLALEENGYLLLAKFRSVGVRFVGESGQLFVHGHTRHDLRGVREALEGFRSGDNIVIGYELLARGGLVGRRVGAVGDCRGIHAMKNSVFLFLLVKNI